MKELTNWLRELWRRLRGKSMTGIGSKPVLIITYTGTEKDNRFIPYKPPKGSLVHGYRQGNIIIEAENGIKYEFSIPNIHDSNWVIHEIPENQDLHKLGDEDG